MKQKKIGIWGLGKVGKSAVDYFHHCGDTVEVIDKRKLSDKEKEFLKEKEILFFIESPRKITAFLQQNDFILPSPGVDTSKYVEFACKFFTELSVIGRNFTKPIIGITGTVGKTTVTTLLSKILKSERLALWVGGNIGAPMLDLLLQKNYVDAAVLELSSFQLENCKIFSSELAIWTNFYPNHLDRHKTLELYFQAKKQLITLQNEKQHALLPLCLLNMLKPLSQFDCQINFFTSCEPSIDCLNQLKLNMNIFYLKNQKIIKLFFQHGTWHQEHIGSIEKLACMTFDENALIIYSALYILKQLAKQDTTFACFNSIDTNNIKLQIGHNLDHRLEKVTTLNGVDFYNDSKSTTIASTFAAVKKLSNRPVLLLLGGLSKGVDRTSLIEKIKDQVKKVYCFGKEAKQLGKICLAKSIPCASFIDLDRALDACFKNAIAGDQILLSPAGSSFDLFKNYKDRGDHFKKLIQWLKEKNE